MNLFTNSRRIELCSTSSRTALQVANNLQLAIGSKRPIYLKRDDLCNATYGGNKVRKLEFLLADALEKPCSSVLTFGAFGSNHALATAIHASKLGLRCVALLVDQHFTPQVANVLRWHTLLGTELIVVPSNQSSSFKDIDTLAERYLHEHPQTYKIAWGGSTSFGSFGFVNAGF